VKTFSILYWMWISGLSTGLTIMDVPRPRALGWLAVAIGAGWLSYTKLRQMKRSPG
jgi:hypothetical protein